jgi:transposase
MKARKKFSKEFKLKAIEMSNKSDSIKDVAISLGIREALLYRWRKEFYQKEGEVFSGSGVASTMQDAEKEELRRLRKENRNLKLERDILKKAVGIFSKND